MSVKRKGVQAEGQTEIGGGMSEEVLRSGREAGREARAKGATLRTRGKGCIRRFWALMMLLKA